MENGSLENLAVASAWTLRRGYCHGFSHAYTGVSLAEEYVFWAALNPSFAWRMDLAVMHAPRCPLCERLGWLMLGYTGAAQRAEMRAAVERTAVYPAPNGRLDQVVLPWERTRGESLTERYWRIRETDQAMDDRERHA